MVDIIPKKITSGMPLKNAPLFIAGALLLAVIFSYVILIKSEAVALLAIEDREADIYRIGDRDDKKIENNVFDSERKIKDFKPFWLGRRNLSEFFDNFGSLIHPQVWFSSFELNPAEVRVTVSGKTVNFSSLEQQIIFLQSRSDIIESFNLSNIVLGEKGGVGFNLAINFTPKIFEVSE